MFLETIIVLVIIAFSFCKIKEKLKILKIFGQIPQLPLGRNIKTLFMGHLSFIPVIGGGTLNSAQQLQQILQGIMQLEPFQSAGLTLLWAGPYPHIVVGSPSVAEIFLTSNTHINKSFQYGFLHSWLGRGLLTSGGDKWRNRRKMLTPSFHFKILEDFIPIMNENIDVLIEVIEKNRKQNDNVIPNVSAIYLMCALDIICQSAMGIKMNAQNNPQNEYVKAIDEQGDIFMTRTTSMVLQIPLLFYLSPTGRQERRNLDILHTFTRNVIEHKKKQLVQTVESIDSKEDASGEKKRLAFMDSLIQEHLKDPSFTEEDIREEVDTFMFEGHDTTAWGATWATFLLGHHPDIQRKVQEELDHIFMDDPTRQITMDDLRSMKYLEGVIKEAQRIYPSVPIFGRSTTQDVTIPMPALNKSVLVPSGTEVIILTQLLHTHKDHWDNPQVFNPDRFLANNIKDRHPYSFVPFSAGPRNCIGQKFALLEEKAVLASVLRKYTVTSLVQRDQITLNPILILKSDINLPVRFELRK